MLRYVVKRILIAIPILIGITIIDYALMSSAGSPLSMMVSPRVSQAALDAKALQLGLDQPIIVQYWIWLREVLRGNLGFSYTSFRPSR